MAIKGVKAKGDQFERDLCAYFTEALGVDVFRSLYTKDPTMQETVGACDLMGVPELAVEAKRVEKLSFPAAYAQAVRNTALGEHPVVINRRSRQKLGESYVILSLDDFTEFYRAWGVSKGYFRNDKL
jgi:hypothetical protein